MKFFLTKKIIKKYTLYNFPMVKKLANEGKY